MRTILKKSIAFSMDLTIFTPARKKLQMKTLVLTLGKMIQQNQPLILQDQTLAAAIHKQDVHARGTTL